MELINDKCVQNNYYEHLLHSNVTQFLQLRIFMKSLGNPYKVLVNINLMDGINQFTSRLTRT